jgi:hypothetical protein
MSDFYGTDRALVPYRLNPRKRGWVERIRNWWHGHIPDAELAKMVNGVPTEGAAELLLGIAWRAGSVSDAQAEWALDLISKRWWPLRLTTFRGPFDDTFRTGMEVWKG